MMITRFEGFILPEKVFADYVRLKRLPRMKAPKSARSGVEYWRALSSDQP